MSDYGDDDYSDYGDDWFYVEEEYMPADDLAEHVINSPPPTTYGDEDALENWDRFDYFNDLEYASDGYDDGKFYPYKAAEAKTGQKRKRGGMGGRRKKRQRLENGAAAASPSASSVLVLPPVVWRSQADRERRPKLLDEDIKPYALLKDWRERLADAPAWAAGASNQENPKAKSSGIGKMEAAHISEPMSPTLESDGNEPKVGDAAIDPAALMAALQKNLAAAGGPLSGMDPQQLLQFAMRMMTDQDAGDEIAGELADDILDQGGDNNEDDGGAAEDLVAWLSKQRGAAQAGSANSDTAPKAQPLPRSPVTSHTDHRPPTPPSSEANRSILATEDAIKHSQAKTQNAAPLEQNNASLETRREAFPRKRKADEDANAGISATASKKRAARSYDASTTASQARAVSAANGTRSGRAKRS